MSETIKDQETSSEQGNAKRRRLVRGAVALAPLVLTLRSGALAAASCTGARAIGTLTEVSQGSQTRYKLTNITGTPVVDDVCATDATQCTEFSTGQDPHLKVSGGARNGTVKAQNGNDAYLYCDGGTYKNNEFVAILSSASANSLYPPT